MKQNPLKMDKLQIFFKKNLSLSMIYWHLLHKSATQFRRSFPLRLTTYRILCLTLCFRFLQFLKILNLKQFLNYFDSKQTNKQNPENVGSCKSPSALSLFPKSFWASWGIPSKRKRRRRCCLLLQENTYLVTKRANKGKVVERILEIRENSRNGATFPIGY